MKLFSIPVTHEYVDVIGASDGVDAGMSNLIVATYCAMVTSSQGGRYLGVFPNCIVYVKVRVFFPQKNAPLSSIIFKSEQDVMAVLRRSSRGTGMLSSSIIKM